jgi:hypothetical protein
MGEESDAQVGSMKRLLYLMTIMFFCMTSTGQQLSNSTTNPADDAKNAPTTTVEEGHTKYEVRIKLNDGMTEYYRNDQLVLTHSGRIPAMYHVRGPSGVYAIVFVDQRNSPRIGVEPNCPVSVEITRQSERMLRMQIFDPEVPFVEEYILTPNSVSLISAKEFSHLHANVTAIKEHFDSVRDSLKDASAEEMP